MAVAWDIPTACAILERVTVSALQAALGPVIAHAAMLVSDAGRTFPGRTRPLGVPNEIVNLLARKRVRRSYYIQPVTSRHSQFKVFQRLSHDVASEYLDSYLRWFQQVELSARPFSRASLPAARSTPCICFAN